VRLLIVRTCSFCRREGEELVWNRWADCYICEACAFVILDNFRQINEIKEMEDENG
jgi:hypothetical protein